MALNFWSRSCRCTNEKEMRNRGIRRMKMDENVKKVFHVVLVCLFVLLLYVPSQQLSSWRDGQFTLPHFFPGQA